MRRYLLTLPLLLAVFAFAACGDDSPSTDESAATPAATEEAPPAEATPAAPAEGDAGVKVAGELGAEPKVTVPSGGTPPAGLLYKDLEVGKGAKAAAGQTVDVQYTGVLFKDGQKFDASWNRGGEPLSFPLGVGKVIPGWDQGVVGMKKGGRRLLVIPPSLAYGDQGAGGVIGPGETLVFVVDLEKIKSQ